uniref:Uncharacterized protein n=1 Tax=Globodera rostochiensis TaxID=31243 RepID=A0A914HHH1_GLORO
MAVFTLIILLQLALIVVASALVIIAQCCGGGKKGKKKAKQPQPKTPKQTPVDAGDPNDGTGNLDPNIFLNPPQGTPMPQQPGSPVITPVAERPPIEFSVRPNSKHTIEDLDDPKIFMY